MADEGRVITTNVPAELATLLDRTAVRADRSKSWIVREAIREWIAEETRRYDLTLEALEASTRGEQTARKRC